MTGQIKAADPPGYVQKTRPGTGDVTPKFPMLYSQKFHDANPKTACSPGEKFSKISSTSGAILIPPAPGDQGKKPSKKGTHPPPFPTDETRKNPHQTEPEAVRPPPEKYMLNAKLSGHTMAGFRMEMRPEPRCSTPEFAHPTEEKIIAEGEK